MRKNIIPFGRAKRSVKEVVEKFYQDLDDIEEIVIIAKDREGEWIFANSELENELEWIGSLYKFINKAILEEGEDFLGEEVCGEGAKGHRPPYNPPPRPYPQFHMGIK